MPIEITQTIPLFRIFDIAKAKMFYLDFLGFALDWEHRFTDESPVYMQVSRGGLVLHLSEHHGDCCPGSAVFIWMMNLDEFHREITAKEYHYLNPGIETAFYGARVMTVIDPFGNKILFNEKQPPVGVM